jgi:hypothetical protein
LLATTISPITPLGRVPGDVFNDLDVDVSTVRRRIGLNHTQFSLKFGFSPATRVLLAVIAKHPDSVEDVLKDRR